VTLVLDGAGRGLGSYDGYMLAARQQPSKHTHSAPLSLGKIESTEGADDHTPQQQEEEDLQADNQPQPQPHLEQPIPGTLEPTAPMLLVQEVSEICRPACLDWIFIRLFRYHQLVRPRRLALPLSLSLV
jgi:hypothetical protein